MTGAVYLVVDLTGSKLGEAYRSVALQLTPPPNASRYGLRVEAAAHYGVPLDQVGLVLDEPPPGWGQP